MNPKLYFKQQKENISPIPNLCWFLFVALLLTTLWINVVPFLTQKIYWHEPTKEFLSQYHIFFLIIFISLLFWYSSTKQSKSFGTENTRLLEVGTHLKELQHFLSFLPQSAAIIDVKGNIIFTNEVLFEKTSQNLINLNIFEGIKPENTFQLTKPVQMALKLGHSTTCETSGPGDLKNHWFEAHIQPFFQKEQITHLVVFLNDITEKRNMEFALKESQSQYQEMASSLPGMVYQFSRAFDGTYGMPYASNRTMDLFQVKADAVMKDVYLLFAMVHPEDKKTLIESIEQSAQKLTQWKNEFRIISKDGQIKWIRGSSLPHVNENGTLWNGVMFDITEEKTNEINRIQLEKKLQQSQKMEALGTLARGIAHDFNNFLQIIMMSIELGQEKLPFQHESISILNKALVTAKRGRDLIGQIMSFCRNEESEKKDFDLSLALTNFLELIRPGIPPHIMLINNIQPSIWIRGNCSQIQQILINLFNNASYALKQKKGLIKVILNSLKLSKEQAQQMQIQEGLYAEFIVEDTGEGMNELEKERLFDPFFTTKPPGEGSGLGLSVVHGIIRSHCGVIEVESSLGKGSTFKILLPALEPSTCFQLDAHEYFNSYSSVPHQELALLIEDDKDLLYLAATMLEKLGYQVIKCSTGEEALTILRHSGNEIHLLITDHNLPGISGIELIRLVHQQFTRLAMVLITGHIDCLFLSSHEDLKSVNLIALLKPFSLKDLKQVILQLKNRPTTMSFPTVKNFDS